MAPTTKSEMHAIVRDIAVWAVTAVCGFLAYTTWQVSIQVERLVVEVKHIASSESDYEEGIKELRDEILQIRREQMSRTKDVYEVADLRRRIEALEKKTGPS